MFICDKCDAVVKEKIAPVRRVTKTRQRPDNGGTEIAEEQNLCLVCADQEMEGVS